jgi:hypothetical protein
MDGRNIVILVLFGIAITARTMPVACMVMAARAVILMRRELGGSYRAKFALACLPCVRWRTFVPDQYWPVVERFRRRLVAAAWLFTVAVSIFLLVPLLIRRV